MEFIKPSINGDLTSLMLQDAIDRIGVSKGLKLIVSNSYSQRDVLEAIFSCNGRLDIPFEISSVLPTDSWILLEESGQKIFYSEGA